ncbi:dienelactone hydrolase family protein [Actinomadura sp. 9N407]|uniref:dienelactone hydrolase family protein n=1 Tax=Actinomadura sp. 9N407 TaxID=3375154 RepID=UPI00379BABC5
MPDVSIAQGVPAYLAVPDGEGPWPAVVIVFEATGASEDMRAQADRFAAQGYLAVLPDFYDGGSWLRCVRGAMRQMVARRGPMFDQIESARVWAAERDDCTGRVGLIGFCMGGGFALVASAKYDFQAASVNYGIMPRERDLLKVLDGACPIVAGYGGLDRSLRGAAGKIESALTSLDVPHDVKEYPTAGHSFLTESKLPAPLGVLSKVMIGHGKGRSNAADGWEWIFAFFGTHVK